ncbi:hypothetical protein CFIMG_000425RA [Ceratocystis fimbriata CBS 114723]|uniref:Transmembrane protein 42 n=1 Tax=Ceratocystis fimbriata CBS 114723 TaxID=1035309 RepID=A0A2C5XNK9_9PEZI|nr:hypothetical protein CFIMG_000425RA [Ceratocystis fimbriata CBS 114723]
MASSGSEPLLSELSGDPTRPKQIQKKVQQKWIFLAVMSGLTAATNGLFAKLSTTESTGNIAAGLAEFLGLGEHVRPFEAAMRLSFFVLNLVCNGIMWALFTRALATGNSTTQVSMVNTSANFMATAVMGWAIFSESLPPLWFVGASLLVIGNVIIGNKDEGNPDENPKAGDDGDDATSLQFLRDREIDTERYHDDEDIPQLSPAVTSHS